MLYEVITEIDEKVKAEVKKAHKAGMSAPNPTPESIHEFVLPPAYEPQKYT